MSARIEVEVGADIKGLKASLDLAKNEIGKFGATGGQSLQSFTKGTNSAAFALTNLGRVAQDAPFGFIGIQNNLNPLLDSFAQLKKETGSTGSALKALGQSLMGPAGLGIALSVVSAGILLYQQYQQRAKSATDAGAESNKEYAKSLDSLASSAAKEVAKLSVLYDASQNLNIPLGERRKIVDRLQDQYPGYLKNFSDEEILAGKAAGAYRNLTNELINAAVVRGGEDLISAQVKKLAELTLSLNMATAKTKGLTDAQRQVRASGAGGFIVDEAGDLNTIEQYKTNISQEIKDTQEAIQAIIGNFNAGSILGDFKGSGDKKKTPFARPEEIKYRATFDISGLRNEDIDDTIKDIARAEAGLDSFGKAIQAFSLEGPAYMSEAAIKFSESIRGIDAAFRQLNEVIAPTISAGFTAIGEALATGSNPIQAFGNVLLTSTANLLGELGKLFIKKGTAYIAMGIAENIILPGLGTKSILAGTGMIAAGAGLSIGGGAIGASVGRGGVSRDNVSNPRRIPGFATGVKNFSGGLAVVGERGPELVNLPKGSDVIANNRLGSMMGNNSVIVTGDLGIEMGKLVVAFKREEALMGRRG